MSVSNTSSSDFSYKPSPTINKIRGVLDSTNHLERFIAKFPVINEIPEAVRIGKMIAHFALDLADGKPWGAIKRGVHERGAEIIVDLIPTGSAVTEALGLRKLLKEPVTRASMAYNELFQFNPTGAWEAVTKGQVSTEGFMGRKIDALLAKHPNRQATATDRRLGFSPA